MAETLVVGSTPERSGAPARRRSPRFMSQHSPFTVTSKVRRCNMDITQLILDGVGALDNVRAVVFFPGITVPPVAKDDVYALPQGAAP